MIAVRVTISDGLMELPDRIEAALLAGMQASADAVVTKSRDQMAAVGANASGNTSAGIAVVGDVDFEGAVIVIPSPGKLIEEGRPAGKVPPWSVFEPILQAWAAHKGIDATRSLYPIAVKIRRDGYAGRFPFKMAVAEVKDQLPDLFGAALAKELG